MKLIWKTHTLSPWIVTWCTHIPRCQNWPDLHDLRTMVCGFNPSHGNVSNKLEAIARKHTLGTYLMASPTRGKTGKLSSPVYRFESPVGQIVSFFSFQCPRELFTCESQLFRSMTRTLRPTAAQWTNLFGKSWKIIPASDDSTNGGICHCRIHRATKMAGWCWLGNLYFLEERWSINKQNPRISQLPA